MTTVRLHTSRLPCIRTYSHMMMPITYTRFPTHAAAEITGIAAADIVHDFLSMLLSSQPPAPHSTFAPAKDEL